MYFVLHKYVRIIQKLRFDTKFSESKIQNIVGSCDIKFPIHLENLAYNYEEFSSYEPKVRLLADISSYVCRLMMRSAIPWSKIMPNVMPYLCIW